MQPAAWQPPKPTQTAASLSSQPCTCPSARLSANQGRAWHKEPLSPPLWPQVHRATPSQGETAGTWSGFVLQSPGDGGTALPPPSAATRLFLGAKKKKKKAARRLPSDFASDYPRLPLTQSPSLRSCSWLCPDEITSSPPRSGAPFWVLGQAGRARGCSQHISQGILPLVCPENVHPATPTHPQTSLVPQPLWFPVCHSPPSSGLASIPAGKQRRTRATTTVATMVPPPHCAAAHWSPWQLAPGRGLARR